MNWIVRNPRQERVLQASEGDDRFNLTVESLSDKYRLRPVRWLAAGIFTFALLYGISYLALFWLSPYQSVEMRSQLVADYSTWELLVFQPVDPAVIEEIKQERGLSEQIVINGSSWLTPVSTNSTAPQLETQRPNSPAEAQGALTPILQVTPDGLPFSPTASQPTYDSTPQPTSVISPSEPMATSQPAKTARPTKTRKPPKTQKPPKSPRP